MDESSKTNDSAEIAQSANEEKEQTKTFSQEEMNEIIRKRINDVNSKNEERVKTAVADAIKEYERQAQLTAEEKAVEETKKHEAELAQKEHDLLIRENRAEARELLQEKGISAEILDYVVDTDLETTKRNISKFEKLWNKAVEDGVQKKTAGRTMTDPSSNSVNLEAKTSTAELLYGKR